MMNFQHALSTLLGGLFFAFFLQTIWGRLVNKFGSIGGVLAAMFIPGTMWILNHGINNQLIFQFGSIWIDMSWAAVIGAITFTKLSGKSIKEAIPNILSAILGGILAGIFICFLEK